MLKFSKLLIKKKNSHRQQNMDQRGGVRDPLDAQKGILKLKMPFNFFNYFLYTLKILKQLKMNFLVYKIRLCAKVNSHLDSVKSY